MSMNTYVLHEDCIYLDKQFCAFLTRALNLESGLSYAFDEDPQFAEKVMRGEIPEDYLMEPVDIANIFEDATAYGEFEGHVETIEACKEPKMMVDCHVSLDGKMTVDNRRELAPVATPIEEDLEDDSIAILFLDHEPNLFNQAYATVEDIVIELISKLEAAGYLDAFPDGYDFRRNICKVHGTYFC